MALVPALDTLLGGLPQNIDTTYADRSAGDKAHQEHHDRIHEALEILRDWFEGNEAVVYLPDGSLASPALAFALNPTTGLHRPGADHLAAVVGATLAGGWYKLAAGVSFGLMDGTAALPGMSFWNDINTGVGRFASDTMTFVCGGVGLAYFSNEGATLHYLVPSTDDDLRLGAATLRYKEIYAVNPTIQTSDVEAKTDVAPMDVNLALVRARQVAGEIISFRWPDGTRRHTGFSARGIGAIFGDENAAYIDPAVEARQRQNPHDPVEDQEEHAAFEAQTAALLAAPKMLRSGELLPYAFGAIDTLAAQNEALTAQLAALTERVAALEAAGSTP